VLRTWAWALMAGLLALMPSLGFAADEPIVDKGDVAWMMTATVLVVLMVVPGLANAEIAARVMQFMASDEFPEVMRMIKDDPMELVRMLLERLRNELLRPENVWRFLILSGQHNPLAPLLSMASRRRTGPLPPATTRMGRVVRSLRMLGERIHNALARVRERTQGPVRAVQGNIARRPTLSWVLRRAVHVLEILPDLIPPELLEGMARGTVPTTPEGIRTVVSGHLNDMENDMRDNTVRLLEGIHHIELPGELINLTVATELVMDLILERLGPKARIVNRLFHLIPMPQETNGRFSGFVSLHTYISNEVANVWRSTPLDPNTYWQQDLLPVVNTKFTELRDEVVSSLYRTLNTFLGTIGMRTLSAPEGTDLPTPEAIAVPFEAEASFNPHRGRAGAQAWHLSPAQGRPLPAAMRSDYESRFGQDFSHVRLHAGASSLPATEPIGADAVTSGSHVYLHPAISLASPQGRRTLAHELTHVVQQTGAHSAASPGVPALGRSGRLRFDPVREAQADFNAGAFERGDAPLKASGAGMSGIQPSLSERTMESIINALTTVRGGEDFTSAATTTTPAQGGETATALWAAVWQKIGQLQTNSLDHFAAFTANPTGHATPDVRATIKQQLMANRAIVDNAIVGIVRLSQRPRHPRVEGQPATELAPRRFIDLLESYIFAERGISLQVRLNREETAVDNVKVVNVALDHIGGASRLWDVAVDAAFAGRTLPFSADNLQNAVRQRLRALGPQVSVWDSNEFKLSRHFVDEFIALRETAERGTLTDVPPKARYLDVNSTAGDSLAIGTHGRLTSPGRSIGAFGRESHHTSQFLLAEFFGNDADASRRAFPTHHAQSEYPSAVIFGSGGKVRAIEAPGQTRIDIASLDPTSGRGDNMPAILIAARTHRRGELHVLRESSWTENSLTSDKDNTTTQGIAIENTFTRALPEDLRPRDNTPERRRRFVDAVQRDPAGANRAFHRAVVATYHWMYGRMIPALEQALVTEELAYYNGIAALNHTINAGTDNVDLHSDYKLTESDLRGVFRAAKANNDRVMSGYGWPTPSL
jgi:hypothetical protein